MINTEKILLRVYNSRRASLALRIISELAVIASVLTYCLLLFLSFRDGWQTGLAVLLSAAIPFFFVGFIRAKINAPRPYELYDFYERKPKERAGRSYPSRHAYSVFVIATLSAYFSPWLAVSGFIFGISLCVCRVLLGIHFIRDVAAGALLGLVSGLLGIFIMLF